MILKPGWWTTGPVFAALASASVFGGLSGSGSVEGPVATRVLGVSAARSTPDTTPPTVAVTFPAAGGAVSAGAWTAGCKTVGVCGTAADAGGVQSVQVALRQASSGRYWTGTGFTASAVQWLTATGTKSWAYGLARPADGAYTLSVRALDGSGNTGQGGAAFTVDTVAPPVPVITSGPESPTFDSTASLAFTDAQPSASLRCRLDKGSFAACGSGGQGTAGYADIGHGDHVFQVQAVDAAGNASPSASYGWTVAKKVTFPITGTANGSLAPGVEQPLNLSFTNPQSFAVRIVEVSITLQDTTTRTTGGVNPDCSGTENFAVTQPFTGSVVVPGNGTVTLSDSVVPASRPRVTMHNLATNQDGCKDTRFTLSYLATAVKA